MQAAGGGMMGGPPKKNSVSRPQPEANTETESANEKEPPLEDKPDKLAHVTKARAKKPVKKVRNEWNTSILFFCLLLIE